MNDYSTCAVVLLVLLAVPIIIMLLWVIFGALRQIAAFLMFIITLALLTQ